MKSSHFQDLNSMGRKQQAGRAFAQVKREEEKKVQTKAMKKGDNPFRRVEHYPEKRLSNGETVVQIPASHDIPARVVTKSWSNKRPLQLDIMRLAEKINGKYHRR